MLTKDGTLPKFAVGSRVRAKKGRTAPNDPDIPLGGWLGTVSQVSGTIYLVQWSSESLEAAAPIYHERWRRDGVDFRAVWLQENSLEADPERAQHDQRQKKICGITSALCDGGWSPCLAHATEIVATITRGDDHARHDCETRVGRPGRDRRGVGHATPAAGFVARAPAPTPGTSPSLKKSKKWPGPTSRPAARSS